MKFDISAIYLCDKKTVKTGYSPAHSLYNGEKLSLSIKLPVKLSGCISDAKIANQYIVLIECRYVDDFGGEKFVKYCYLYDVADDSLLWASDDIQNIVVRDKTSGFLKF